ncbi:hypothetical protein RB195_004543 [Necator americanus]|uniref:C2H2-type domain-containing protein n=1 Tax=Necator americanus TaxID=51031 RepID=A0ABR1BIK9_NECAM
MGTVGKCSVCQRGPFRLNHLYHHLRRVHSWNEEQIDEERAKYRQKRCFGVYQFQCDLCQNVYLTHRSWQRHRELFHFTGKAIEPPYVVCSGCQQKFENNSALAKHWNVEHTEQECAPGPSTAACPPIMIASLNSSQRIDEVNDRKPTEVTIEINLAGSGETSKASMEDRNDEEHDIMQEKRETRAERKRREELESARIVEAIKKAESMRLERLSEAGTAKAQQLKSSAEHKREDAGSMSTPRKGCQLIPHPTSPQLYSTVGKEMPTIKDLLAWKETQTSTTQSKRAICYAIVGISSVALRTTFRNLMERFDFDDLVFVNNPAVEQQLLSSIDHRDQAQEYKDNNVIISEENAGSNKHSGDSKPSTSQQPTTECSSSNHKGQEPQTISTGTKESREPSGFKHSETRATNGGIHLQGIPLQAKSPGFKIIQLKTVPSVNEPVESVQSGNENIHPAPLGVARIRQNSPIDEEAQKHVPKNEETPAGSVVRISTPEVSGKNENSGWNYCCLICGRSRSAQEVRHSSNKRQQNIVFLACLQVWNIIDMESAKQIYRDLQHSRRRLCHDHYVQAAAYIGKEVEDMWGKFPEHGIDEVPSNIREDLLAYVQVYGEYLDETITLSSEDIAQFYYECLKKYYKKKRWSVQEIGKESKKKGNSMRTGDQLNLMEPSSSNDSSLDGAPTKVKSEENAHDLLVLSDNGSLLFNETKDQLMDSKIISAMDLMEPEAAPQPQHPQPQPPQPQPPQLESLILVGTASVDGEGALSVHLDDPEKHDASVLGLSSSNPTRVFRDNSSCLDTVDDEQFRSRFRMTRRTFGSLCKALDPLLKTKSQRTGTCSTGIKVGMALEILAGNNFTFTGGSVMQTSASQILADVLETLLEWSATMIQWPDERDCKRIGDSFFEMTGLTDIVGCIDGTIINGFQNLNVGLVADDQKRFRWVFAKFHSDTDDDSVFKRSLLCKQLREGLKKGRLIGDDAYKSELFLLAPNQENDEIEMEDGVLASILRKAHSLVEEAIGDWKRQFPILKADIRSSRIARIIVSCAALYNLTRLEGEPPFPDEEGLFKMEPADIQADPMVK